MIKLVLTKTSSMNKCQFTTSIMLVVILLAVLQCDQIAAETSVRKSLVGVCQLLKYLDNKIANTLKEMPKHEGESLVKDMEVYNSGLAKLEELLVTHRNETLKSPEATELLREGAPDYFHVNIDRDTAMLNFGWLDKGLDEVFKLRSASTTVWTRLNRRSRLIPLEFYSYPENTTYVGYESPIFPPLKEKMTLN